MFMSHYATEVCKCPFFMRHKTNYESPVIHVLEIHPESAVMIAASLYTVPGMDPGEYPSGGDDLF